MKQPEHQFRDAMSTVDKAGKRVWVYPKAPKGKLHNYRALVAALCIAALFAGPLVKINGQPLILCNIFERKFILFGQAFFPQDFYLFALALVVFFLFIILFTVVYGRVWCGWACPQTVFMEMVFRKIEYAIEGDAAAQRRLDAAPWNAEKIAKRSAKYGFFLLVSGIIAHLVMAYLIGTDQALDLMRQSPAKHPAAFLSLMGFTGIFYFVFAFMREQVCTTICPYGRLQGVLLDKNSAVVSYDYLRGEPRGKKGTTEGDCVDCSLCVQVCPTGIDIRNGLQLECVACTACIDACNDVMIKLHRPQGLIRVESQNGIETRGEKRFRFNARVASYTAILVILLGLEVVLLANRQPMEATVMRVPGMLYQNQPDGRISNLYNVQLMNKTFEPHALSFRVKDNLAEVRLVGKDITLPPAAKAEAVLFIIMKPQDIKAVKTPLEVEVLAEGKVITTVKTNFAGPVN